MSYEWDAANPAKVAQYKRAYKTRQYRRDYVDLQAFKLLRGCVDCGYAKDARGLQFDHVRGQKVATVSAMLSRGTNALIREIAKCEVRCATCHAIATEERRSA